MGYYSRLSGELMFHPELSEEQLAVLDDDTFDNMAYGGTFTAQGWNDGGDSGKMYYLEDEAQLLLSNLSAIGCSVTGTVVVEGEDNTDVWRLVFKDNTVVRENASVRWPDGTEYRG